MFCLICLKWCYVGSRTVGAKPEHLSGTKIWVALKMWGRNPCIGRATWTDFAPNEQPEDHVLSPPHPHASCTLVHTACSQICPLQGLLERDKEEAGHICLWAVKREVVAQTSCWASCAIWGSAIVCRLIQDVWLLTLTAVKPLIHSG